MLYVEMYIFSKQTSHRLCSPKVQRTSGNLKKKADPMGPKSAPWACIRFGLFVFLHVFVCVLKVFCTCGGED